MTEKTTIKIEPSAKVDVWRDGRWTILYIEDGSGAKTTISLGTGKALDLAALLKGHAISASVA